DHLGVEAAEAAQGDALQPVAGAVDRRGGSERGGLRYGAGVVAPAAAAPAARAAGRTLGPRGQRIPRGREPGRPPPPPAPAHFGSPSTRPAVRLDRVSHTEARSRPGTDAVRPGARDRMKASREAEARDTRPARSLDPGRTGARSSSRTSRGSTCYASTPFRRP